MAKSCFAKAWALALGLGIGAVVAFSQPSFAREPGAGLEDLPGGGTFGSSADNIPVGIFMVDQFFTRQLQTTAGPAAPFEALLVAWDLLAAGDADAFVVVAAEDAGPAVVELWEAAGLPVPESGARGR